MIYAYFTIGFILAAVTLVRAWPQWISLLRDPHDTDREARFVASVAGTGALGIITLAWPLLLVMLLLWWGSGLAVPRDE